MKSLIVLAAAFVSVAALAQDNAPTAPAAPAAQTEAAPAIATAADPSASPGGGHKICLMVHGHLCALSDKSLEPGAHCMCHDHPGTVEMQ